MSVAELDQLQAAFTEAQEALAANPDDDAKKAAYKEAKTAFANARQQSRSGRGAAIVADEKG